MLPYVKQMTSTSLMHEGTKIQCSGTTQRDRVENEMEWGFTMGGHMYTHGRFMSMHGKNHQNIVIILQLKNKII